MINILPDGLQLPIHWNIYGEIDKYADATTAFLFPPLIMILILTVFSMLSKNDPQTQNIQRSKKAITAASVAITLLLATFEFSYVAIVNGIEVPMMKVVGSIVGIVLIIIGNYLGKTRSNFFIGIRTPWTLSSDNVWQKTHRFTGKLFMIIGLIIMICCWLIPNLNLSILIISTVLPSALIPCFYSWRLWKAEQNDNSNNNEHIK